MSNDIFDISGNLYFSEIESEINESFKVVQPYIVNTMQKIYSDRLVGEKTTKDIVGDIRRAIMFLVLIRKEVLFDENIGTEYTINDYIEKYETEAYRDYLVCRGIDKDVVDQLFNIFGLNYSIYESSNISVPPSDVGIGNMEIDGSNQESIFKIT